MLPRTGKEHFIFFEKKDQPVGKAMAKDPSAFTVNEVAASPILEEEKLLFSQMPVPATHTMSIPTRGRQTLTLKV